MTPHALAADLAAVAHDLRAAEAVERSAWVRYVKIGDERKPEFDRAQARVDALVDLRSVIVVSMRDTGTVVA